MTPNMYTSGEYLVKNPTWHVEDSPHKTRQILKMLKRNSLSPKNICEVGCGAGEILRLLQQELPSDCNFWGYDISADAYDLCKTRANDRLHFKCMDFIKDEGKYDVILLLDLIEHMEDYFSFLRELKSRSEYKILHIPLDLFILKILFGSYLVRIRRWAGHIHYFTKELALEVLRDTGYEIIDFFYTPCHETPAKTKESYFIRPLRRMLFGINQDLTTRFLGGFYLMVLAK